MATEAPTETDANRCWLCETIEPPPEFPFEGPGAARIQLRCGCSFHTSCWLLQIDHTDSSWVQDFDVYSCPACNEHVFSEEMNAWSIKLNTEPPRKKASEVWATSEEFRRDVREVLSLHKQYKQVKKSYETSMKAVKEGFRDRVKMPIEAIKEEYKRSLKEARHLPGRAKTTQLYNEINTKLRRLKTYGIKFTLLHSDLQSVPDAPKQHWFGYSPEHADSPQTVLKRVIRDLSKPFV